MTAQHRLWLLSATFVALSACGKSETPVETSLPVVHPLSVVIGPPAGAVATCNWVQLNVTASNFAGAAVTPDSVRWSSSGDTTLITISAAGLLTSRSQIGIAYDAVRVTVWQGSQTGAAQAIWSSPSDLVLIVGPDGKPVPPGPCKTIG